MYAANHSPSMKDQVMSKRPITESPSNAKYSTYIVYNWTHKSKTTELMQSQANSMPHFSYRYVGHISKTSGVSTIIGNSFKLFFSFYSIPKKSKGPGLTSMGF